MSNEKSVIQAVVRGDAEAFAEIVRTHQARVRLACLVRLGHSEEADDAAQEVFVKAYKSLELFRGEASLITWLLHIADNHCRDVLRKRKTHRADSLDALLAEKGDVFEGLLSRAGTSTDFPAHTPEDLALLARLFAALPEEDREILTLREVEELSYDVIAERLRCSLDAVKGRLKRARQNLILKCGKFSRGGYSPTAVNEVGDA